jgi:hypothetical protein
VGSILSFFEDKVMLKISGIRRDEVIKGEERKRRFKICILQSDD